MGACQKSFKQLNLINFRYCRHVYIEKKTVIDIINIYNMYCPNCKIEIDGKFCFECGTKLIEKPSTGSCLNLGDANAISGGVNLQDSHDVHNIDNSIYSTVNNTVNNITNVAGNKTEMELLQERKNQFSEQVNIFLSDNELQQEEVVRLEELRIELGLDEMTAKRLIENARRKVSASVRKTSLKGSAATMMKIISSYFMANDIEKVRLQIPKLAAYAKQIEVDEVQHKYYVALAAIAPEKLIELCEQDTLTDNYWRTYWSYVAYHKLGEIEKAENALTDLYRFTQYPEENISLLQVVEMLNTFGEEEARTILDTITDIYSEELGLFAKALYLRLNPEVGKGMGANKKNTSFYLENIISFESPEKRTEREAIERAEAEAKAKAKAEAEARKQISYTIYIKSVPDQITAMMLTRNILGWSSSVSRKKLAELPAEALVTDDKSKVMNIFEKLQQGEFEVDYSAVNGLGEKMVCIELDELIVKKLYLVRVRRNGKYGYVDKSGHEVIPCKYDDAEDFIEGLAKVEKDDKYGFIDKKGREVIPCKYDRTFNFSEGLARAVKDDKYGFIDKEGIEVIPCKYDWACKFSEGLAKVKKDYKYGFIDKEGIEVIPCKYDDAFEFSEGLACVEKDDKWGFIDKVGREVIPCKYDDAGNFSEGLAYVRKYYKYGFIDKEGIEVIPCKYDYVGNFSEGLAYVEKDDKEGFIDREGREVIPCKYYNVGNFSDGLAKVYKDDKCGFIDKEGREVITRKYDWAGLFSEGLAKVKKDFKYGFIDKEGREVIPRKYDGAEDFSEGLAYVKKDNKWGYIDKTGREIIPFIYESFD